MNLSQFLQNYPLCSFHDGETAVIYQVMPEDQIESDASVFDFAGIRFAPKQRYCCLLGRDVSGVFVPDILNLSSVQNGIDAQAWQKHGNALPVLLAHVIQTDTSSWTPVVSVYERLAAQGEIGVDEIIIGPSEVANGIYATEGFYSAFLATPRLFSGPTNKSKAIPLILTGTNPVHGLPIPAFLPNGVYPKLFFTSFAQPGIVDSQVEDYYHSLGLSSNAYASIDPMPAAGVKHDETHMYAVSAPGYCDVTQEVGGNTPQTGVALIPAATQVDVSGSLELAGAHVLTRDFEGRVRAYRLLGAQDFRPTEVENVYEVDGEDVAILVGSSGSIPSDPAI